jgi:type VI secretion system secreted protein VgrG
MTKNDILISALVSGFPAGFRKALALVLEWECEYESDHLTIRWENDPADHGGSTYAGLTIRDDGISEMLATDAHWIVQRYFNAYWSPLNGLPILVQEMVFYEGVNVGMEPAIRALQLACNDYGAQLVPDSKLGDKTRSSAFSISDTTGLCMGFLQKMRRHYESIVVNNPSQAKFLSGWENRVNAAKALLA